MGRGTLTHYTNKDGERIRIDKQDSTGFVNYNSSSFDWIEKQVSKRTANELTGTTPIITVLDKEGKYSEEGTKRLNFINRTSWYSENDNTSFEQVIWDIENRISPERSIGLFLHKHQEEFTDEELPLITLAKNVILENRENNKSTYAYFILSRKKVQNAYLFTVAVSKIGTMYVFDYQQAGSSLALTEDEIENIIGKRDRRRKKKNTEWGEVQKVELNNKKFVYHQILFNLPNAMSDMDYIEGTQLTDMLDQISFAMLWEIQANQTKVVLLTAVASGKDVAQKQLAKKKLKEWRSQIQINIETANTTDQQSITVHNPQLQNTLPVYTKTYKELLNLIYQLVGNAKDQEANDKGTAQQSITEIKGLGGNQYETIAIKKKLRQMQMEMFFKRVIEYDRQELGATEYPEDYEVQVIYTASSESDKSELLKMFKEEQDLGIKSKTRMIMEYDKTVKTKDQALKFLEEIQEENKMFEPEPTNDGDGKAEDGEEKPKKPKQPKEAE